MSAHARVRHAGVISLIACAGLGFAGCATRATTAPTSMANAPASTTTGIASWYGPGFHGKRTANGEWYDQYGLTAAHRTWPLGTMARVTNLANGRTILVRINDRGPFIDDREIDLSYAAARALEMVGDGTSQVRIEPLERGDGTRLVVGYAVQLASFFDQPHADAYRDRVARLEPLRAPYGRAASPPVYVTLAKIEQGTFYRVRVGPCGTRGDAQAIASRLAQAGLDSMVVEENVAVR